MAVSTDTSEPQPQAATAPGGAAEPTPQSLKVSHPLVRETSSDTVTSRFLVRGSYLGAHYDSLESDLQNGATSLALGLARQQGALEGRLSLEIGHGLDQSVTPENTRYLIAHADGTYVFYPGSLSPIAGAGIGYGKFDVRSVRSVDGNTLTIREHAQSSAFVAVPSLGLRLLFAGTTVDLTGEYLALLGAPNAGALGGWQAALALGIPF